MATKPTSNSMWEHSTNPCVSDMRAQAAAASLGGEAAGSTPAERAATHHMACSSQPELGAHHSQRAHTLSRFSCGPAAARARLPGAGSPAVCPPSDDVAP